MWSLLPSASQRSRTDHVPVLANEVRTHLAVQPGETVVDATFGAGGHAHLLAADLEGKGRFIGIDRDASVRPYFERFQREARVQSRFLRGEGQPAIAAAPLYVRDKVALTTAERLARGGAR